MPKQPEADPEDLKRRSKIEFSPELFDEICELIASGENAFGIMDGLAIEAELEGKEHWPTRRLFFRWCKQMPERGQQFHEACVHRIDALIEAAANITKDYPDPYLARVQLDALKFVMHAYDPRRSAQYVHHTHDTSKMGLEELQELDKQLGEAIGQATGLGSVH